MKSFPKVNWQFSYKRKSDDKFVIVKFSNVNNFKSHLFAARTPYEAENEHSTPHWKLSYCILNSQTKMIKLEDLEKQLSQYSKNPKLIYLFYAHDSIKGVAKESSQTILTDRHSEFLSSDFFILKTETI